MVLVVIFARDNDKPGNQELINFLQPNFAALLQSGLTFDIKIICDKDIPDLLKRGIDKLPAAEIQGKKFLSSVEIKSILMRYLGARTVQQRKQTRDPEDEVRDFYRDEMTLDAVQREAEEAEEKESKKDLMSKYQDEVQRRAQEDDKTGKNKAKPRAPTQRGDNVPQEIEPVRRSAPRDARQVSLGGDPNNSDDRALESMFEQTED